MSAPSVPVYYRTVKLPSGTEMFYRESGSASAPHLLLLHGFPTSSHMFRDLIPLLSSAFHIVAPDLPGFGQTVPAGSFQPSFAAIAQSVDEFVSALSLTRYSLYVFDYGAPTGFRLALAHPERVQAVISQNGNMYEEGLGEAWAGIQKLWREDTPANREALHFILQPSGLAWQYQTGVADTSRLSPDGRELDLFYLSRPGQQQLQLDLFYDYRSNVALYPQFQAWLRQTQPPLLAVWGQGDPFFVPAGAAAFKKDQPKAEVHMLEGAGHFALETHSAEIAQRILNFSRSNGIISK